VRRMSEICVGRSHLWAFDDPSQLGRYTRVDSATAHEPFSTSGNSRNFKNTNSCQFDAVDKGKIAPWSHNWSVVKVLVDQNSES